MARNLGTDMGIAGAEYPGMRERREFLTTSSLALLGVAVQGLGTNRLEAAEPIIDIHQHVGYRGRPNDVLLSH